MACYYRFGCGFRLAGARGLAGFARREIFFKAGFFNTNGVGQGLGLYLAGFNQSVIAVAALHAVSLAGLRQLA